MNIKLQTFNNCKDKNVQHTITVEKWIEEIQNGYNYKELIETAREDYQDFGKLKDGKYNQIKCNKLPVIAWNFLFKETKTNKNAITSTGYLYIDIDNSPSFDINSLPKESIFCFFKSLSESGWGIVVKVEGVTVDNFKLAYENVIQQLGLTPYYDKNAVSIDRNNVMSYDPNLFFNSSSKIIKVELPSVSFGVNINKKENSVSFGVNREREERHITPNDTQIFLRETNFDDYVAANDVAAYKEGKGFIRLYLPKQIKEGKRKHTLLSYTNNLVYLNPKAPFGIIYTHVSEKNQKRCIHPLNEKEIRDICNAVFRYKKDGSLKPKEVGTKKIFYGKNCGLNAKEKQDDARRQVGEWRTEDTKQKIKDAIIGWPKDKKITAKLIGELISMGEATVKRNWVDYKIMIDEINKKK